MLYLYETGEPIESSHVKMISANISHSEAAAVCSWKTTMEQTVYLVYSELQRGVHQSTERRIKAHYTQAEQAEKLHDVRNSAEKRLRMMNGGGLSFWVWRLKNISNMCFNVQGINR